MMILKNALRHEYNLGQDSQALLQQLVLKICLWRILFLFVLLFLFWFAWLGKHQIGFLEFFLAPECLFFLVAGFGATIFFLLSWPYFNNIFLFFRLQLIADLTLASCLVFLTGGITSNFSFLYLGIVFLYGRILGLRPTYKALVFIILFFLAISILNLLQPNLSYFLKLDFYQILYYLFLQFLALGFIVLLLKMGNYRETKLLQEIERQKKYFQRSENLKQRVFDWMHSGLIVLDQEGNISFINRQALVWANISSSTEVIGTPLQILYPSLAEIWSHWNKKDVYRVETEPTKHTEKIFGATFTPIPDGQGSILLFTDITKIKELEERIQQMEKLASVGELAAGLAHEIKNPLSGIKGSLQLILQNNLNSDKKNRLYQVIQRDINRLDRLLTDFMAFAKPTKTQIQKNHLAYTIQSCVLNLQSEHPQVTFDISSSLQGKIWIWDPDQLKQVCFNLLINAIQAVDIVCEPQIQIGWDQDYKGEFIYIKDNGCGLDPSTKDHIFDPFVSSKNNGLGLGLAIAQRMAGQNQSWIEVRNREKQGAEARVYSQNNSKME